MPESEDQKWKRLQREREQNRTKPHGAGPVLPEDADDRDVLQPHNEGRDDERLRARMRRWEAEQSPRGRVIRAIKERALVVSARKASPGPGMVWVGVEDGKERHATRREKRVRGGEPKKHPRQPE